MVFGHPHQRWHFLLFCCIINLVGCEPVCKINRQEHGGESEQQGWLSVSLGGLLANIMFEYAILLGIAVSEIQNVVDGSVQCCCDESKQQTK
jgi:hypothetical protein